MKPRSGRPGFFRVIRYDKTLRGSQNAVRYVAFRSEDVKGKTPCIFDERSDTADVNRFMRDLEDRVTRHPTAAKAYHAVFSLKRVDFDQAGMTDWRDVVRQVVRTYELERHRKLEWIASYHDNPTHPHCHVIIKATYINENGQHKKLFLNRNEVQRIKEITGRELESRGLTRQRSAPVRAHVGREVSPMVGAVGSMLAWLEQQIKAERRRREREQEEHWRWLAEQEREDHGRER
jgi:hypothetical protein